MRKFLIPAALLASVAIAAAPATAQPRQGGYGHNQGNGYGHNRGNHHGFGGAQIERELVQLRGQIERLRDRRLISSNEYRRLRREAEQLDRRLDRNRRGGLSPYEARDLRIRLARLRDEVRQERREGRRNRW